MNTCRQIIAQALGIMAILPFIPSLKRGLPKTTKPLPEISPAEAPGKNYPSRFFFGEIETEQASDFGYKEMESSALLSCPRCGEDERLKILYSSPHGYEEYWASCLACAAITGRFFSHSSLAYHWNERDEDLWT